MKVVVVGKGGREHALAEKFKASRRVQALWVCPGNAGMQWQGIECVDIETPSEIAEFCRAQGVSLVVVGPEAVILSDLKTRLTSLGIACFAPEAPAAQLEASKLFCKKVLQKAEVPTAAWQLTHTKEELQKTIDAHSFIKPLVLKADGLAQGKGVWVCESLSQAREGAESLSVQFGFPILVEECLQGKELSAFALCDEEDFVVLGTACDYKRITANPFSANTGGMGAYSPCDFLSPEEEEQIRDIFKKTLRAMHEMGFTYQGFLFAGLMKTEQGLKVLEFNVRLGDPETQALLPRLESDLADLIWAATQHELKNQQCELSGMTSVHVVAVSEGYPQSPMKLGKKISWPQAGTQTSLYFASVKKEGVALLNSGGRVLGVTALALSKSEARQKAYADIKRISFEGMYLREDIGL